MGVLIVRQPNGLLCRFSTITDTITHLNMTEDEYIKLCMERAKEQAIIDINKNKWLFTSFEDLKNEHLQYNYTRKQILELLREMGDTETTMEDLNKIENYSEGCDNFNDGE